MDATRISGGCLLVRRVRYRYASEAEPVLMAVCPGVRRGPRRLA
jgi:hypothetical protein